MSYEIDLYNLKQEESNLKFRKKTLLDRMEIEVANDLDLHFSDVWVDESMKCPFSPVGYCARRMGTGECVYG